VWNYDINGQGLLAAATSPSPSGPFTLEIGQINVRGGLAVGDFALFVDDDGMGKRKRGQGRKEKQPAWIIAHYHITFTSGILQPGS
jgi:hypothetical protein